MALRLVIALLLPTMILASSAILACVSLAPSPELGPLYNRAAQQSDRVRNPIVVIPGILGSMLSEASSERTVWGAFGGGYANPGRADGARLVALPMGQGKPLAELRDDVLPTGVLDRFRVSLLGLPFEQLAYVNILSTLGAGGYRDRELAEAGAVDYGDEHFTCFQFAYDWRRDNAENAARLDAFLRETREEVIRKRRERYGVEDRDVRFDIVAHSMGGLVTRYFLRYGHAPLPDDGAAPELSWAGAELVERAILIGTPNAGSADALLQLVRGKRFAPLIGSYPAAVLGTMPSLYQLLPRSRHGALVEGEAPGTPVENLLDPALWQANGWGLADPDQDGVLRKLLPEAAGREERRAIALDHQAKSLARAAQFARALDRPADPPEGLELHLYAGDAEPTPSVLAIDRGRKRLRVREEAPGDGVVLRSSAVMDERAGSGSDWTPTLRSPIGWTRVTFLFTDHLGMTRDPAFTDNLLYQLLEAPRQHAATPNPL